MIIHYCAGCVEVRYMTAQWPPECFLVTGYCTFFWTIKSLRNLIQSLKLTWRFECRNWPQHVVGQHCYARIQSTAFHLLNMRSVEVSGNFNKNLISDFKRRTVQHLRVLGSPGQLLLLTKEIPRTRNLFPEKSAVFMTLLLESEGSWREIPRFCRLSISVIQVRWHFYLNLAGRSSRLTSSWIFHSVYLHTSFH